MSSVTLPLYHYALLKGYLVGHNPPSEVMAALEALHMAAVQGPLRADALDAIQAVREAADRLTGIAVTAQPVKVSGPEPEIRLHDLPESAEPELPPLTMRALEKAAERIAQPEEPQTDEAKVASFLEAKQAEQCPPAHAAGEDHEVVVGPSEPKKRREWSPEARAAAAERMRATQARKKAERQAKEPEPTPPHRLTVAHPGYAGKRDDGQLLDEDWPDIKARLARGDSRRIIASDYEVDPEDLDHFIASNQRREAKQPPGEARAPLRPMMSGAS